MKAKHKDRNLRCRRREARQTLAMFPLSYRYMRLAILYFARWYSTRSHA